MTTLNVMLQMAKRVRFYLKTFRKPLIGFSTVISLALAWKFVPVVFMLVYTPPPFMVNAEKAMVETWQKELSGIGTVVASRAVTIACEVSGVISTINFESGQEVEAGTAIAQLNDTDEQAQLKRYSAQQELAKVTLERTRKLTSRNVQSVAQLDQDQSKLHEAESYVNSALAIIAKKNIRAPFAGTLGIRQVNLGQYLSPGQAIVTLTDAKKVYINFTRPERDRQSLKVGQKVVAQVDSLPNKVFTGTITTIDPQINQDTRTIPIQSTFDNPDLALSSGMFAEIKVVLPAQEQVVTVPETAVDFGLYGSSVFIVTPVSPDKADSPLTVNRQYVKVGDQKQGRAAILEGVKADDLVVTAGQLKLNNGAKVALSEDATPPLPNAVPTN